MVEVTHLGLLFFFPSTLFPFCLFKRSRSAASQASSDDVHEKVKMNRPFWSKHPSIKPKAGLPRRVCSFYSESTHTHTHTLLLPPSTGEKCLRFQSGCTNLPSFFLAFQTNCFTCIWKPAAVFSPRGAAYIRPQCQRAGRALMHCLLVLIK